MVSSVGLLTRVRAASFRSGEQLTTRNILLRATLPSTTPRRARVAFGYGPKRYSYRCVAQKTRVKDWNVFPVYFTVWSLAIPSLMLERCCRLDRTSTCGVNEDEVHERYRNAIFRQQPSSIPRMHDPGYCGTGMPGVYAIKSRVFHQATLWRRMLS